MTLLKKVSIGLIVVLTAIELDTKPYLRAEKIDDAYGCGCIGRAGVGECRHLVGGEEKEDDVRSREEVNSTVVHRGYEGASV